MKDLAYLYAKTAKKNISLIKAASVCAKRSQFIFYNYARSAAIIKIIMFLYEFEKAFKHNENLG